MAGNSCLPRGKGQKLGPISAALLGAADRGVVRRRNKAPIWLASKSSLATLGIKRMP
jgi:hypothetical protein